VPPDPETIVSGEGGLLSIREGIATMGGQARSGRQRKGAGNSFGTGTGLAGFAARNRHPTLSWKMVGRPAYLPASVPLGLSAG
jgi:hypothetical protein